MIYAVCQPTICQVLGNKADTPDGVVDASKVPVAEHHAGIYHGRQVGVDGAPDVALQVDELEQLRVLDVLPGHLA